MRHLITGLTLFASAAAYAQQQTAADTATLRREIAEVTFNAAAGRIRDNISATQMGKADIPAKMLKSVPSIGGEPDILKAVQLTPGVKRGAEGTIGAYVRGGGKDENLILMDGAPVYNAGHMLGFFSVFNSQAVKDVQLLKSCFPARYGGRLSSVMDVKTNDGGFQTVKGNASLGLISSSLSFQGPVLKDKLSFFLAGRRSYVDKLISYIPSYFYDLNGKLVYRLNGQQSIFLSVYNGRDLMDIKYSGKDSANAGYTLNSHMNLGNEVASIGWSNKPAEGLFKSDLNLYYSGFRYTVRGQIGNNSLSMQSAIKDVGLNGNLEGELTRGHLLRAGMSYSFRHFNPNIVQARGASLEQLRTGEGRKITSQELAVHLQDDITLSGKWQLSTGIRLSAAPVPGKTYINPEPRVGFRYQIKETSSLKASYARMAQYMQLVSSSSLTLPTDLWYPVTQAVQPGISDQVSAGYYHAVPDAGVSLSAEAYYKWMYHLTEYREGAVLVMNNDYEQELLRGKGRAYGLELLLTKTTGKLTGWIGYSLSWAHRQFDSLNNGASYYARYDRRHDLSVVALYRISERWTVNSVILYATGTPFTGQQSQYVVPKPDYSGFEVLPVYTTRNAMRLSASFRIDLDIAYRFALGARIRGDIRGGVYNLLNRTQPYAVQRVYNEEKKAYVYEQKGLFGAIPSVAVNFNF